MLQINNLPHLLEQFCHTSVLVIGDVMLDEYLWGNVSRISPEAPVPILDIVSDSRTLGGAANVIHNLRTLGANAYLCSVIGEDATGQQLRQILQDIQVDTTGLLIEPQRPTTIKTRIIAQYHRHYQQMVRLDRETRTDLTPEETSALLKCISQVIPQIDAIIIEDYGKGVVTSDLVRQVVELAGQADILVAVDPKTNHIERYKGVSLITPNHFEAGISVNTTIENHQDLLLTGRRLLERLELDYALITRGKDGMSLFERESRTVTHIPTMAREVFDVAGAGDTVIAAFTLALASEASPLEAALLSNAAAGVVVGKMGVETVDRQELQTHLEAIFKRKLPIQRETFA